MAGLQIRNEYYWNGTSVVRRINYRPSGHGPWGLAGEQSALVIAIEVDANGISRTTRGPAHAAIREAQAVLLEYGLLAPPHHSDFGTLLPARVAARIENEVRRATKNVTQKYRALSNEERMTGALFGGLPTSLTVGGWRVRFRSQGYSSTGLGAKEARIGADAGVVVELEEGTQITTKALWLQAKRVAEYPDDIFTLPDLSGQMRKMAERTKDGYALIFTPDGVFVTNGAIRWPFEEWLISAVRCERGDRDQEVLAETVDRSHLLRVQVTRAPRSDG